MTEKCKKHNWISLAGNGSFDFAWCEVCGCLRKRNNFSYKYNYIIPENLKFTLKEFLEEADQSIMPKVKKKPLIVVDTKPKTVKKQPKAKAKKKSVTSKKTKNQWRFLDME